jgi:hypothetical protein
MMDKYQRCRKRGKDEMIKQREELCCWNYVLNNNPEVITQFEVFLSFCKILTFYYNSKYSSFGKNTRETQQLG